MKKLKYLFLIIMVTFFASAPPINADTYQLNDLEIMGYNNNGSSLTTPSEFGCSDGTCGMYITTNANSYGGAWIIESPISLVANYTYTLSLRIRTSGTSSITLSAKNNIAVGTSISNAKSRYESSNFNATMNYSRASGDNTLQFAFTPTSSGSYLVVPFTTTISSSSNYFIDYLIIDNMGNNGLSQSDINNSLSNQTNEINNSINNSTNTITGSITDSQNNINSNIDDMEQSIIDSNKETQDVIKDQFNSCRDSVNLAYDVTYQSGNTNWFTLIAVNSTNIVEGKTYTMSVYLQADSPSTVYWNNSSGVYDEKIFDVSSGLNRYTYTFVAKKSAVSIPIILSKAYSSTNTTLITPSKLQIQEGDVATAYEEPNTQICTNKIDDTNNKLDDLNQNITNDNVSSGTGSDFFDSFTTNDNGGISAIVTAPLSAIEKMVSGTCTPIKGSYKGKEFSFPCGDTFWAGLGDVKQFLNVVLGGFLCYGILAKLYLLIDRLKDPEDDRVDVMKL